MLELNGELPVETMLEVQEYTDMRIRDKSKFVTPEALALYEQQFMQKEDIKKLCERTYGFELHEPVPTYMPDYIVRSFEGTGIVPVQFSPMRSTVVAVYLPEFDKKRVDMTQHKLELVPTTLYFYFERYSEIFGKHEQLQSVPPKMLADSIIKEGIQIGAADVTISTRGSSCSVYYNVRKRTVYSKRILTSQDMDDIILYLTQRNPWDMASAKPKYVGVDLNELYRGRVVINKKFKGYAITIRLLPKAAFDRDVNDLNLSQQTIDFLTGDFMDREPGLRVISGATMSGKNTTILTIIKRIVAMNKYKVVSIEMPVEQELYGIEQIEAGTTEEYKASIRSLIRQNPDFVYVTEMNDDTGSDVIQITNTGKCMYTTTHANNAIDTLDRLVDESGFSMERIIQTTHSIVYQELVRDDESDTVRPRNRFIRLTQKRKLELYGLPHGEIIKKLAEWEEGDVW